MTYIACYIVTYITCYLTYKMDQFENNWWSALANTNKLRLFVLGQCQLRPSRQPPLNCHC